MQIFKASTYRLSKKETICLSSTLHELSLIVMWGDPIAIKLRKANIPKRKFCIFYISKAHFYLTRMHEHSICNITVTIVMIIPKIEK
ncbi:hypothetical protein ICG_05905 [Bacillus cereus BAG1X1-3]|nr:hypothetical protein ICG_05905 [Bacillus cereus BAG1X1-3]EOO74209.1 hypothetical protein IC7_05674 [Bacillus cereus BAG1O-1]PEX42484.1 hypothetical protein CN464_25565 [Bacillus cereus]PFM23458.1 hypothetical protein COJ42_30630 [Bacillus cereus]PFP82920.1 hypothetical protein COK02_29870 [Bacillus cereus]